MEEYVWISKVVNHPVFVSRAHPVLRRLAMQYGVNVTIAGPEDADEEPYLQAVYDAIRRKVAGIMVIGWGGEGIVKAINAAIESGIPVVTVDADVPESKRLAHVGTNWFRMGGAMADQLGEMMDGRGKVLMIGMVGQANMRAGFRGFEERMKRWPEICLLGPEDDLDVSFAKAEEIVTHYLRLHPDLTGVAGFDGNSGPGAAIALKKMSKAGRVRLVCVDAEEHQLEHLRAGAIDAAFCQRREAFTCLAFQMLYSYNHGSPSTGFQPGLINLPGDIETGFVMVTRENIDSFEHELHVDEALERHCLSQELELLSAMVRHCADAAMVTEEHGRIVSANPAAARTFGRRMEELRGLSLGQILLQADGVSFDVESHMAKGGANRFEGLAVQGDGSRLPVEVTISPLGEKGPIRGFVVRALNISERLRLHARMQEIQRLESLGMLAGGIAHYFNNLLTGILGNADLALAELAPDSPARHSVTQVMESARRAAKLARDLLAYSGKGRFVVGPLDLSKAVEEMRDLLAASLPKKLSLRYDLADGLPPIEADAAQIQQLIMNLVVNAAEAIGDKPGIISLATDQMECDRHYLATTYLDEGLPEGRYVYLEVSDTGCGMDAELKSKIFNPFFSTKAFGRGLGLPAVLGIVRSHRGAIKVYSEPGRGSTFKVLFPAGNGSSSTGPEKQTQTERWHGSGTILLVDDERAVRGVAQRMLEEMGFNVLLATGGREGVALFRKHSHDIRAVILDLGMPDLNGEEVFRAMRLIESGIPVILSSGYEEAEATQRFAGKGLAGFIQKPYLFTELAKKLREVLEKQVICASAASQ